MAATGTVLNFPMLGGTAYAVIGTTTVNSNTTALVTLPISFGTIFTVFGAASDALVSPANDLEFQPMVSLSTFNIRNNDQSAAHTIIWIAIGY